MPSTAPTDPRLAPASATTARDPGDVRALLWYLAVIAVGVLAARGADRTTAGLEADLVELVDQLPDLVVGFLYLAVQVLHLLLFLAIPLYLLARRRWRRWGIYTLGWIITSALVTVTDRWLALPAATDPGALQRDDRFTAWPPSQSVGTAVCAVVLLSPHLSRSWRRFGWAFVAVLALTRVLTAATSLADVVLAIGIGGVVGAALLLAFGRRVERPTEIAVLAALDRIGAHAVSVERVGSSAESTSFRATLADGARLHCKAVSSTQYEADSLLRRYRRVRVRELGEEVAFSTVRRAAAVEAMLAMTAERSGARTPALVGVGPAPAGDTMVIAFEEIVGQTLDDVPPERVTDEVLDQAWRSLAALRRAGIAHRDLQLSSWLLDADERLWLIDFSFGEAAATAGALSADIAELLAATYAVVGAPRAVAAAERALGPHVLAEGISHLVPVALTRATRTRVKAQRDGLGPLVDATAAACGITEPEFAPIERVKPRTLVMAAMLAVAVYVLLPQLADLPGMLRAIREADLQLAAAAAAASVLTYVGSAMAISGACPNPIRFVHSLMASVAATFVGAIAPPGVAGLGLNARFFAKQGMPPAVAISATAAKEAAVGVVHVVLLVLFAIVAGSTGALREELDRLPSLQTIAIAVAIVLTVVAAVAAVPRVRQVVRETVLPAVRDSVASLQELASSPTKMLTLFLGSLLLQVGYIAALYAAARALGGDVGLVTVGLIYLTVGSVASVAPTPGGIGAVEAVLLAALTGVGMDPAAALAAVFLFRLVTFWIPIPIGGLSFRALVSRDLL